LTERGEAHLPDEAAQAPANIAPDVGLPLFRKEALETQRAKLAGEAIVSPPLRGALVWSSIAVVFICAVGLFAFVPVPDIITAYGELVPRGGIVTLRSEQGGTVSDIFVRPGAQVLQGAPILRLRSEQRGADGGGLMDQLGAASAASIEAAASRRVIIRQDYQVATARAAAKQAQLKETLAAEEAQLVLQRERVRIATESRQGVAELLARGFSSGLELRQRQEQELSAKQGLLDGQKRIAELKQQVRATDTDLLAAKAVQAGALNDLDARIAALQTEAITLAARQGALITAPRSGTLSRLLVGPGQSVDTTTPIGIIVSGSNKMDVDLQIPNSIARDLRKGQSLRLTIRAYPSARFGTVKGAIMDISRDATRIDPSKTPYREPVIIARVALDWSSNARIPPSSLTAGMEVTATIQTGRASMLHALLQR